MLKKLCKTVKDLIDLALFLLRRSSKNIKVKNDIPKSIRRTSIKRFNKEHVNPFRRTSINKAILKMSISQTIYNQVYNAINLRIDYLHRHGCIYEHTTIREIARTVYLLKPNKLE